MLTVPPYPYVVRESSSDVPLDQGWVAPGQASAVFPLPSAAQGRTAAEKGQLHVQPGRHPSPTRVLQHLRAHCPANGRPYGRYGRTEAVRTLTHAHSVCGLADNVLRRVPLMPLFLLGNYSPTIPHQLCQHWSGRFPSSTPVFTQELYHEIGKVMTGIVPHWMPARESCLTPRETDPRS